MSVPIDFLIRSGFALMLLPLALTGAGCSKSDNSEIEGTVTFNGVPVPGAKVSFHSVAADSASKDANEIFTAMTDSAGRFRLVAAGKKGIPAGGYKVVVTKFTARPGIAVPPDEDPEQLMASGAWLNALPSEYAKVTSTPLALTVKDGKNKFEVTIEQAAKK